MPGRRRGQAKWWFTNRIHSPYYDYEKEKIFIEGKNPLGRKT
jgi:hypothetical protein